MINRIRKEEAKKKPRQTKISIKQTIRKEFETKKI